MKRDGLFDLKMRPYDDAEVCELVGTFLLDKIRVKYDKNSSVYIVTTGCQYLKTQFERINKSLQKTVSNVSVLLSKVSALEHDRFVQVSLCTVS